MYPLVRSRRAIASAALMALLSLATAARASGQCSGDCDGDGQVTVDELITGVTIALSGLPGCEAFDVDGNQQVTVDEILLAVTRALNGCATQATAAPALAASSPAPGDEIFPVSEWLKLSFSADVDPAAAAGFRLTCDDTYRAAGTHFVDRRTLVINPNRDLPADADCVLNWRGPDGPTTLTFATAPTFANAEVFYDRTDGRRTNPFPDDFWIVPDESLPNGIRVSVALPTGPSDVRGIFRVLLRDTNILDGFSPLAHFVVELSAAPDETTIPKTPADSLDPLAPIGLYDVTEGSPTYGERVPFKIQVRNDTNVAGIPSHTLLIFPAIPLEPSNRYSLVVTRRVRARGGAPFERSAFFQSVMDEADPEEPEAVTRVRGLVMPALNVIRRHDGQPLQLDDVALATRFTIRTTDDIPNDLLAIRAQVQASPPPTFTIENVQATSDSNVAAIVTGTWEAPDWRDGINFRRDEDGYPIQTKTNQVPFILALPRSALSGPAPITMYQHGNPGSAEREVPGEARDYLAEAGFAVMGFTDNLNRELSDGATSDEAVVKQITTIFFSLVQNQHLPDFWAELHGEQLAFLRMIEAMGTLDVLPVGAPDGIPDLDPTLPLTYVGISQGGNYAPGLLPYAPEIRAAAVVVGGARLAEVLIHQQPEAFLMQIGAIYVNMTAADIWTGLSLFQTIYDRQDEHNHARYLYRAPIAIDGTRRKASVLLLEGLNDSLVPNSATESLAWAMGPIPHLMPVQRAVPFLEAVTGPLTANIDPETTAAFYQYVPLGVEGIEATPGCTVLSPGSAHEGHYCAQGAEESERQRRVFFESAIADAVPTIIDPLAPN